MIAILDSGGANIASILYALKRVGVDAKLTACKNEIDSASHLILPGVGSANTAMKKLADADLLSVIKNTTKPILGICLGMQLLFEHSQEGDCDCLGLIPGEVKAFDSGHGLPVPHMGWNSIECCSANASNCKIAKQDYYYFVHSYYAPINNYTISKSTYINEFAAVVRKDNFWGTQFHPEKSSKAGLQLLQNFLELS